MPLTLHGMQPRFPAGLTDLGSGVHAWLQPNGGLGESNAALVVGDGASTLIDTLWTVPLTRRMLGAMALHTQQAPIRTLVNTHGDGDHCWGNQLLSGQEIVATERAASDMLEEDPRTLRTMRAALRQGGRLANLPIPGSERLAGISAFGRLLEPFNFAGVTLTPPTRRFSGELELSVGGRRLTLIEVGPAHTPGDLIVHLADAKIVIAADILFSGSTPIMWVGPVERWLAALHRIEELEPATVLPGHGPPGDLGAVRAMRRYWEWIAEAVRSRLAQGQPPVAAAMEILRSPEFCAQDFAAWDNPERLIVNAAVIARSDNGGQGRVERRERLALLSAMGGAAALGRRSG